MRSSLFDRLDVARAVADAVLYEGYVLYPYRASSKKNQFRWQFGVLVPPAFSDLDSSERSTVTTECLLNLSGEPSVGVRVRCLQGQRRTVEEATAVPGEYAEVDFLLTDRKKLVAWDEAVDQVVDLGPLELVRGAGRAQREFFFEAGSDCEMVTAADGGIAGRLVRTRERVTGHLQVEVVALEGEARLSRVSVTVENTTRWGGDTGPVSGVHRRDEVLPFSLVAVHTMLAADGATFVSMLDPPERFEQAVSSCRNTGTFPVLIGTGDVMLSSPIILYDQPEIAAESPGDLYDSTEIDEILALRVLTLTDEEKMEARGTDARSAAIVDRCDEMSPATWERLHGAVRSTREPSLHGGDEWQDPVPWWDPDADSSVDPWSDTVVVDGSVLAQGSAVILRPKRRSDAQDIFLDGLCATVAGVFKDAEGSVFVAVTVDDDPASEELVWQGRYLFFHPDEVETVDSALVDSALVGEEDFS